MNPVFLSRPSVLLAGLCLLPLAVCAQDAAQVGAAKVDEVRQLSPPINYRERPRFPFDPQRLRLKPILDGSIGESEWTPLYTIGEGLVKGTVYLNWDEDNLYLAARMDQPGWLALNIDCNGDGWLRGADNLELLIPPISDAAQPALTARILDAAGNKDAPVWNDKVVDPRSIQVIEKVSGSGQVIEIAIPKGIAGLTPRVNANLGVRADFWVGVAAPVSTPPYEPHLLIDVSMVDAKAVGAPGVSPRLVLEDTKVVPGQTLEATLEVSNQVDEDRTIRTVTWSGEGAAGDILKSLREVTVPPLKGLKTLKLKYASPLPLTAVPGFYQITATAQLDNGSSVSVTASFQVVEPFVLSVVTEPEAITVLGPIPCKAWVEILNATPDSTRGDVEIEIPAGWEIKGRPKKGFETRRQDSLIRAPFYLTVPSNTPAGDYLLNATITWKGRTWKAHRSVKVVRGADVTAPKPVAPKP